MRETPAIVDVLTDVQMLERGVRTSVEAFNAAPGVSSANVASQPGVLSMRGFASGAISLLHDVRLTTSSMVSRNQDSWGFERIEQDRRCLGDAPSSGRKHHRRLHWNLFGSNSFGLMDGRRYIAQLTTDWYF